MSLSEESQDLNITLSQILKSFKHQARVTPPVPHARCGFLVAFASNLHAISGDARDLLIKSIIF